MTVDACPCGQPLEVVEVEAVERFRCSACGATSEHVEKADLTGTSLRGMPPLAHLLSRRTASGDTLDLSPSAADSGESAGAEDSSEAASSNSSLDPHVTQPGPQLEVDDVGADSRFEAGEGRRLGIFELTGTLGRGGMGVVYRAHDSSLDRDVALKVLSPALCRNRRFIDRFQREARAAAGLSHPNITHVYSIGEHRGVHYYAMELVNGKNLVEILAEHGCLAVSEAVRIMRCCAEGLASAARHHVIHRDVKPSNILRTDDGRVKVTDFGLAKAFMGSLELTTTGVILGTPLYMSPEQGRGEPVDHRSDMYSIGATLFHLIYGQPPFQAETAIALILKHISEPLSFPEDRTAPVPRGVVSILRRLLEKQAERRYATYQELIRDLDAVLAGREVENGSAAHGGVFSIPHRLPSSDGSPGSHSTLRMSKLSVAKANLRLNRTEKALALLREMLDDDEDPQLRVEAALLLLDIHERQGDIERAREAATVALQSGQDPGVSAFVRWKLAGYHEREAIERERQALAFYERILEDGPEGLPNEVLTGKVRAMRARVSEAERGLGEVRVVLTASEEREK